MGVMFDPKDTVGAEKHARTLKLLLFPSLKQFTTILNFIVKVILQAFTAWGFLFWCLGVGAGRLLLEYLSLPPTFIGTWMVFCFLYYGLVFRFKAFIIYEVFLFSERLDLPSAGEYGYAAARARALNKTMHALNGNIFSFSFKRVLGMVTIFIIFTIPFALLEIYLHRRHFGVRQPLWKPVAIFNWLKWYITESKYSLLFGLVFALVSPIVFICVFFGSLLYMLYLELQNELAYRKLNSMQQRAKDNARLRFRQSIAAPKAYYDPYSQKLVPTVYTSEQADGTATEVHLDAGAHEFDSDGEGDDPLQQGPRTLPANLRAKRQGLLFQEATKPEPNPQGK